MTVHFFTRCAFMALCLTATANAAPSNSSFTVATSSEFETLNPVTAQSAGAAYILNMYTRTLVKVDADWKYVCGLCTVMPTLGNGRAKLVTAAGKKTLHVTWTLKPGLKWGDGQPLTAADFRLAWEIGRSPDVSVGAKEAYTRIASITLDPKDPQTFVAVYTDAPADFYHMTLDGFGAPVPSHIEGAAWAKGSKNYEKNSAYDRTPTNPGLASGPYVMAEVQPGSHVVLRRNPHFFGQRPAIDKIVYKIISNTQAMQAALMTGEIDMTSESGMGLDQALAFEKRVAADPAGKYKVLFADSLVFTKIDFNLRNPVLQDVRVRQAMVHAINRTAMGQALFGGKVKVTNSYVSALEPAYTADVKDYPYDKARAAKLLDAAGWVVGAGGLRYKDGVPLKVEGRGIGGNKQTELLEQFVQSELKQVGIGMTIKNEPARLFFGETLRKGDFPGLAFFAWVSPPDETPRSIFHSSQIPAAANNYSGQNSGGWSSPKADALLDAMAGEFDPAKRQALAADLQRTYADELPTIPLFFRPYAVVVPKTLKNFRIVGHTGMSSSEIEAWTFTP